MRVIILKESAEVQGRIYKSNSVIRVNNDGEAANLVNEGKAVYSTKKTHEEIFGKPKKSSVQIKRIIILTESTVVNGKKEIAPKILRVSGPTASRLVSDEKAVYSTKRSFLEIFKRPATIPKKEERPQEKPKMDLIHR